jgi:hypothetical protein
VVDSLTSTGRFGNLLWCRGATILFPNIHYREEVRFGIFVCHSKSVTRLAIVRVPVNENLSASSRQRPPSLVLGVGECWELGRAMGFMARSKCIAPFNHVLTARASRHGIYMIFICSTCSVAWNWHHSFSICTIRLKTTRQICSQRYLPHDLLLLTDHFSRGLSAIKILDNPRRLQTPNAVDSVEPQTSLQTRRMQKLCREILMPAVKTSKRKMITLLDII